MALIARKVLDALQGIYRTVDAPPSRIDFGNPITPVHDVSRQAEIGAALGPDHGFFVYHHEFDMSAGTNQYLQQDLYAFVNASSWSATFNTRDYWIWFMGGVGVYVPQAGLGDIDEATVGLQIPDGAADFLTGTLAGYFPIFQAAGDQALARIDNAIRYESVPLAGSKPLPVPFFCPQGTLISAAIDPNAGIANPGAILDIQFWAGRRGTTPPGAR